MFAECCVFSKQSQPPGHFDPHQLREQVSSPAEAYLLPKLRYHFAEFLHPSSLKRLRIFSSPTRVGLQYGPCYLKLRGFSWELGISYFVPKGDSSSRLGIVFPDLPKNTSYSLKPGQPTPGQPSLLRPLIAVTSGAGILTCFPSTTPLGLALGAD